MAHVLVVEDEPNVRRMLAMQLRDCGHQVVEADGGRAALELLAHSVYDLVVTDLRMDDVDGMDVLREVKKVSPGSAVVVLTAHGTVESGVQAMKLGAHDYVVKPVRPEEVALVVDQALASRRLGERVARLESRDAAGCFPGRSPAWRRLVEEVEKVAGTDATVLLTGESGSGKEVVARLIHARSRRAAQPLLEVNLGAVPASLQESELFGHVRGAFTGAVAARKGLFMEADRGTLLLDEVGEAAPAIQVALLRALGSGEIRPVGGDRPVRLDVRVLAATNADLQRGVREGRFREDLFFRLNVVPLRVPPLRERAADVPELAGHLLGRHAVKLGRPAPELSDAAVDALVAHSWPGNVRELDNVLERALILHEGPRLEPEHLALATAAPAGAVLRPMADVEREHLLRVLEACDGHRQKAAEVLGIGRATLFRKLREYGITDTDGGPHAVSK